MSARSSTHLFCSTNMPLSLSHWCPALCHSRRRDGTLATSISSRSLFLHRESNTFPGLSMTVLSLVPQLRLTPQPAL
ncbi:hypothetical protein FA95DRAFT_116339 [Auriscalpium vulgare]|uniref:Uncharacterized protein n=1 Tax=Auriscalpium vulgare TaxID=40419 RepID=A0ACB8R0T2_9AGAM|nr:hypothetical protein FA95DRAFT_116339 [Auriscalpium vulgare]